MGKVMMWAGGALFVAAASLMGILLFWGAILLAMKGHWLEVGALTMLAGFVTWVAGVVVLEASQ